MMLRLLVGPIIFITARADVGDSDAYQIENITKTNVVQETSNPNGKQQHLPDIAQLQEQLGARADSSAAEKAGDLDKMVAGKSPRRRRRRRAPPPPQPLLIKTGWGPERYSWKIEQLSGGKWHKACSGKGEANWYSARWLPCRLAWSGTYVANCEDKYGEGWGGGYLQIRGMKLCDKYTWGKGKKCRQQFQVNPLRKWGSC